MWVQRDQCDHASLKPLWDKVRLRGRAGCDPGRQSTPGLHFRGELVLDYGWGLSCCFSRHTKVKEGQHCHSKKAVVIFAIVYWVLLWPWGTAHSKHSCGFLRGCPALLATASETCVLQNRRGPLTAQAGFSFNEGGHGEFQATVFIFFCGPLRK